MQFPCSLKETHYLSFPLTNSSNSSILHITAINWNDSSIVVLNNRLSRKGLDIIYRLIAVPQARFCVWGKSK